MNGTNLCVSIPIELQSYCKSCPKEFISKTSYQERNFGVKLFKKAGGEIDYAAYYSDSGDLIKKVYYDGFFVILTDYYRNNTLYCREVYDSERISKKSFYDKNGTLLHEIEYGYNRQGKVLSIIKSSCGNVYKIEYGYDELERVNSRIIVVNGNVINEQKYRFDILDRILEYSDSNQRVKVLQISPNNELIYYTITDKMNNEITVENHFSQSGYKSTDVTLNGHTISIVDRSYVDNIMLKKPYTTEDDLDLIIARMFSDKELEHNTKRTSSDDIMDDMIKSNIKSRTLPISIRKRLLYSLSLNAS